MDNIDHLLHLVEIVVDHTQCNKQDAITALAANGNNVVEAIMTITQQEFDHLSHYHSHIYS